MPDINEYFKPPPTFPWAEKPGEMTLSEDKNTDQKPFLSDKLFPLGVKIENPSKDQFTGIRDWLDSMYGPSDFYPEVSGDWIFYLTIEPSESIMYEDYDDNKLTEYQDCGFTPTVTFHLSEKAMPAFKLAFG